MHHRPLIGAFGIWNRSKVDEYRQFSSCKANADSMIAYKNDWRNRVANEVWGNDGYLYILYLIHYNIYAMCFNIRIYISICKHIYTLFINIYKRL